jgi:iron-sulfur cluster insertion protein
MNLDLSAVTKIKEILAEEGNENQKLRIFVQGGGCSGFSYGFTLDEEENEDDFKIESNGVELLVDSMSIQYLQGAKIRYDEGPMGSSFAIENPNAQSTCGCGASFSPY